MQKGQSVLGDASELIPIVSRCTAHVVTFWCAFGALFCSSHLWALATNTTGRKRPRHRSYKKLHVFFFARCTS
jgi:hypothetical protein